MTAPTYCRIHSDGHPCRMGLYVDEHKLLHGRWVHPDLDDKGRWTWPEESV